MISTGSAFAQLPPVATSLAIVFTIRIEQLNPVVAFKHPAM